MGNIEKFDAIANNYDTKQKIEINSAIVNAIKNIINTNKKNGTALDFGCGTGLIGIELIEDFDHIIFIDASYAMIEQVKEKIKKHKFINTEAICCDIEKQDNINSKLFDTLNNNGHLIIIDFDKNYNIQSNEVHNGFNQYELSKTLTEIGYKEAKSRTFYFGKDIFMGKDASLFILYCKRDGENK